MLSRLKEIGLLYSFAIIFNRVVPAWLFRFRRFQVYVTKTGARETAPKDGLLKWADSNQELEDASELTQFYGADTGVKNPFEVAIFKDRQDTLMAAIWVARNSFMEKELGLLIELNDDQRWLFSAYVDKRFRRAGRYRTLMNFATTTPNQCLLAINPDNRRSMLAHEKLGVQCIGKVVAWRFLKLGRVSAHSQCDGWRFEVVNGSTSNIQNTPTRIRIHWA